MRNGNGATLVAWIALAVAVIALIVGWSAYARGDQSIRRYAQDQFNSWDNRFDSWQADMALRGAAEDLRDIRRAIENEDDQQDIQEDMDDLRDDLRDIAADLEGDEAEPVREIEQGVLEIAGQWKQDAQQSISRIDQLLQDIDRALAR